MRRSWLKACVSGLIVFAGIAALAIWYDSYSLRKAAPIDPELRVIFPKEKAAELISGVCSDVPTGITGYWTPSNDDLESAESAFSILIHRELTLEERYRRLRQNQIPYSWSAHLRQATGVFIGERKLVFINYYEIGDWRREEEFRRPYYERDNVPFKSMEWLEEPYSAFDGGVDFPQALFDPVTRKIVWYHTSGPWS